jgi:DNA-binding MarR family transcriptional regulator
MDSDNRGPSPLHPVLRGLLAWEERVLWAVRACGPCTGARLIEALREPPSAVAPAIHRLRVAGLVSRTEADPALYDVTAAGRELLGEPRLFPGAW